jgi:hypothetical protein
MNHNTNQFQPLLFIALLALVLSGMGCKATSTAKVDQPVPANKPVRYEQKFSGAINNQYQVVMLLRRDGKDLSGTYFYTKNKVDIGVGGVVDDQDKATVNEFVDGKPTGKFVGALTQTAFSGTWTNAKGDRSFPFSLTATGSPVQIDSQAPESAQQQATQSTPTPTPPSTSLSPTGRVTAAAINRTLNRQLNGGNYQADFIPAIGDKTDLQIKVMITDMPWDRHAPYSGQGTVLVEKSEDGYWFITKLWFDQGFNSYSFSRLQLVSD